MIRRFLVVILLHTLGFGAASQGIPRHFFTQLSKMQYDSAKMIAALEKNDRIKMALLQLADILYYEGQTPGSKFRLIKPERHDDKMLKFVLALSEGYLELFYNRTKANAYKSFYSAYQLAGEINDPMLVKAALLAFFRYYDFEKVQLSDSYRPHLEHFEKLVDSEADEVWLTIYRLIFYSKPLKSVGVDPQYFHLVKSLDMMEGKLDPRSPMLTFIFFEQAIKHEIAGDLLNPASVDYYKRVVQQAGTYPFLKDEKFYALIKLANIEVTKGNVRAGTVYWRQASRETNLSDTLRSNFYLNYYGALLLQARHQGDSAFDMLMKAYVEDLEISHMKNNLEMNRLNTELQTQEKENANLQLKQNLTWVGTALGAALLLMIAGYLGYVNQRNKTKMELQSSEVQAVKLEAQLKEQEMHGIDLMIAGQEKERQRIANDLHDDLGGQLAAVKIKLEALEHQLKHGGADADLLTESTDLVEEAYQRVRSMAHERNAGLNAQEGLLPAVRNFAAKVSTSNRLAIRVEEHGLDSRLENSLEITLFRVIQELITNIVKHARATEAIIHLTQYEDSLNIMVEDNGVGFERSAVKASETMGLYSIQKRIEGLGGEVTIESILTKGTTIILNVPVS